MLLGEAVKKKTAVVLGYRHQIGGRKIHGKGSDRRNDFQVCGIGKITCKLNSSMIQSCVAIARRVNRTHGSKGYDKHKKEESEINDERFD